jgi:predicted aminopeptidase
MIRKILLTVAVCMIVLILFNFSLVRYGMEQAVGQLRIVWAARPVEEIFNDPLFPDSLKKKLVLIGEVRRFAIDSLGLKDTKNYRTVYDQKGNEVMWVVTACEPYRLVPKYWSFPIIGSVPYKGYFNRSRAMDERTLLEKDGWDVSVRNPGGWSTLGWFNDPILSDMLEKNEGDLASLIIHEMVHSTIWLKDSVDYNENLATFIGDTAAYSFLRQRFGLNSAPYFVYLHEDGDYRRYSHHMLRGAIKLDSMYHRMNDSDDQKKKKALKNSMIRKIVDSLDTLTLQLTKHPSRRFSSRLPNNAYFMSFRHYQSKLGSFKAEMNAGFSGNLKGYVQHLAEKYPR